MRKLLLVAVAAALLFTGIRLVSDAGETTVVGYFENADGLYRGDDVKVLGVAVGEITKIEPEPTRVKVTMQISGDHPVPSEARAAIVSPSLVSGRFVQLSPAYTSGKRLADGASIALTRTAVPVSFDDVKQQLTDLSTALAPKGSTSQPLRETIQALEANLKAGNATQLSAAIKGLREAAGALSDGRSDLFGTISNLNSFTQNLAVNDAAVTGFTRELDSVSTVLSTNRRQLTQAIGSLSAALGSTGEFLDDHRARIRTSVRDLNLLGAALADRSNELAGALHVAPTALIDLYNTIENQAIAGRASLTGLTDAAQLICGAVLGAGGTAEQCRQALAPLVGLLKLGQEATPKAVTGPKTPDAPKQPTGLLGGLLSLLGVQR